ncbi:Rieske (2Fe-2S) protein [Brachybacterium sp. EF45031]|uniref:Rieske (2Fe-2S) protein n=1 Tax=Brachybacterium sillae TaxID=2810536 RepID=UPI00217DBB87|nr:Rieske (2Fe-2S) protein [Brachybacterium sillae]MCS6712269.1 Rieske (2Fe-2S) protein [Brachybacterium sillae]
MERPCLSRRHALGALSLGVTGAGALSACGPEDEGFKQADSVVASDGAVPLDSIPENATTLVSFGAQQPFVLVVRGSGDDLRGLSGYCTHNGCALTVAGKELDCPCHGSRFDATTGDVLSPPAPSPLPEVPLTVEGGMVRKAES